MLKSSLFILFLAFSFVACSPGTDSSTEDAGSDTVDSGSDTLSDAPTDTLSDTTSDSGSDAQDGGEDIVDKPGEIDNVTPILSILIVDVGQGDAAIISIDGGKTLLFDTGRKTSDGEHLGQLLSGIARSDLLMAISHFDSDHMGASDVFMSGPDGEPGVAGVDDDGDGTTDERLEAGEFGAPGSDDLIPGSVLDRGLGYLPTTQDMDQYLAAVEEIRRAATPGELIELGAQGPRIEVVATNGQLPDGTDTAPLYENDRSLALFISYGAFDILLPGDLPAFTEALLANYLFSTGKTLDVLHTGHHGSTTSTDPQTLSLLSPEVAIISVGDSASCGAGFNTYGHPSQETLDTLSQGGVGWVFQTQEGGASMATSTCTADTGETFPRDYHAMQTVLSGGDILIETDGIHYTITAGGQTHTFLADAPMPY